MIYKFVLISDETDNFHREILINSEATFFDLHHAILDCVGYTKDQVTSFFLCNDDWEKESEITLFEMDTDSDVDSWVMDKAILGELIPDEKQKLIYVFDNLNDRIFFMEMVEILYNNNIDSPKCIAAVGDPPPQFLEDDFDPAATISKHMDFDESFYGEDNFNADEFDEEDFDNFPAGDDDLGEPYL